MKTLVRMVAPFTIKAAPAATDPNARTFEGLAAVFGDVDLGNDIIQKGAFKDALAAWKKSGEAIPLLNSHDHFDIMAALGQLLEAKETPEGLWTKWEVIDGPDGDAALARLRPSERTGRAVIGKMSIGFEPQEFEFKQPEGTTSFMDRIRILKKVNLKEVSLVLFPMAPGASIDSTSVKSVLDWMNTAEVKSLTPAAATDLRRLASRIGLVLKQYSKVVDTKNAEEPAATPAAPAAPEPAAPAAPAAEPTPAPSAPSPTPAPDADAPEAPAESVDEPAPSTDGDAPAASAAPAEEKHYLMGEALQQRIRSTLLKHKTSNITQQSQQ